MAQQQCYVTRVSLLSVNRNAQKVIDKFCEPDLETSLPCCPSVKFRYAHAHCTAEERIPVTCVCTICVGITWRDALETVINSRKLSDALGNPSTEGSVIITHHRQEQHYALLKNKIKETYYIKRTTQIRRLTTNLTKPGTFILL